MDHAPVSYQETYGHALTALRSGEARRAELQLRQLQGAFPGDVNSMRLLGLALLAQNELPAAAAALERTVEAAPDFSHARTDLARVYRRSGRPEAAHSELLLALKAAPSLGVAWLVLGDVLVDLQRYEAARDAFRRARALDPLSPRVAYLRKALLEGRHTEAEDGFKELLRRDAGHVGALCGLACVYLDLGLTVQAQRLVRHALTQTEHAPQVLSVHGQVLLETGQLLEAEAAVRRVLLLEPQAVQSWIALGAINGRLLRADAALAAYEQAEAIDPGQPLLHLSIGHVLKALGRREECERVYQECIERQPRSAESYWSLADLKVYRFNDGQVQAMERLLEADKGAPSEEANIAQLHFAVGRAYEQRNDSGKAFAHYDSGNRLRRRQSPFDYAAFEAKCQRIMARLNAGFFESARGGGHTDDAPIFIVGLPRSGSTLVEQILASHPRVDGTMELPNILHYVRELECLYSRGDAYPESLQAAPAPVRAALGRRYIEETQPLRTGRARFIDKLPNNFLHVGLIHAILPNATIIDVRRHPMDACFSCFKQYFASGQSFTYDLEGLGRYYRQYLALMAHWDAMLPGKVLHFSYEALLAAPEAMVRRLLAHCGLAFEPACLNFHETKRAIRTASSEQVRQPLYTSAIGHWRHYEAHLEPLRRSLGDCVDRP